MLTVYLVYNVAFYVYPSVLAYFMQERFDWTAWDVGVSLALFGLSMAVVQGGLVGPIVQRLGEHRTVILGICLNFLAFLAFCVAWEGWMIYLLAPVSALGGLAPPAMQGIMSRTVRRDAQGELQGITTSVAALSMILAPLVMTQVFGMFTSGAGPYFPAAPFAVSAGLCVLGLVLFTLRPRQHGTG